MLTSDPLDLFNLQSTCRDLKTVVQQTWGSAVDEWLRKFAISCPIGFLMLLDMYRGLLSGPGLVGVIFPKALNSLASMGFEHRLEIHLPSVTSGVSAVSSVLSDGGYYLLVMLEDPADMESWTERVLGYHYFGATLHALWSWARLGEDGKVTEVTVFVNKSADVAIGTVLEQPSTLFMNYVADGHLTILYPSLTLNRRGIINNPCQDDAEYWFVHHMSSDGFQHSPSLSFLPGYSAHRCGTHPACPNQSRQLHDVHSLHIPFSCYGYAPLGRAPFVDWRLKCVASCQGPKPYAPHSHRRPRYAVGKDVWGKLQQHPFSACIDF